MNKAEDSGQTLRLQEADWMIEEYKALRAEIIANEDYQKNLLIFGTSVLAAALGFIYRDSSLQPHRNLLLFLTEILAISFWYAFQRLALATEEIGTYILYNMEAVSALNWEIFQRVEKLKRFSNESNASEASPSVVIGPTKRRQPQETIWKNKKNTFRRFVDSFTQAPFLIFGTACPILILREVNTNEKTILLILSSVLLLLVITVFCVFIVKSSHPRVLRQKTEQQLQLSALYRKDNNFFQPTHLKRHNREP